MDYLYRERAGAPNSAFPEALGILSGRIPLPPRAPLTYSPEAERRHAEYSRALAEREEREDGR